MTSPSRRALLATSLVGTAGALTLAVRADAGTAAGGIGQAGQAGQGRAGEPEEQRYAVPGLTGAVRVTYDAWGVPHIAADSIGDAFQAQGFTVARDRLFQIDTWRRRGLGLLSEVLGPDFAEQDRAARLFLYRGSMAREWASYGPGAREAATRFAAGVNAYVGWLADNPDALPTEFTQLGYEPARWQPEDVVRIRSHGIGGFLGAKVTRARLVSLGGTVAGGLYKTLEPEHEIQLPEGLDLASIPADVLAVYNLATAPVTFQSGTLTTLPDDVRRTLAESGGGSNAWAVAAERTATGRPILAGDPHRENYTIPANRYIAHLRAPGLDIIGAGEPWNPGISMGHNGHFAFGLTNLPTDNSDLYVYELHPDDPTRYRYGDGWQRMRTLTEEIPVAGGEPRQVELSFTRHGPVVRVDADLHRAYAVRTVWSEPGTSPYLGSLALQQVTSFTEFAGARGAWKSPGSNLVYADTAGDIGWVPGTLAPRRPRADFDGLLPVPGDGRYEWDGFQGADELPLLRNPREGFVVSANEYNFPESHTAPSFQWQPPYRADRIREVLGAGSGVSLADTTALQNDEVSLVARWLLPYLGPLTSSDPATRRALELLRGYDGVTDVDSAAAALFETWVHRQLWPAWARAVLAGEAGDALANSGIDIDVRGVAVSFERPDEWFGEGGAAVRDGLLLDTLGLAWADVAANLGDDPQAWRWGAMHVHQFAHPLGGPSPAAVQRGGSFYTVRSSYFFYGTFPYPEVLGPTFKMAIDVGDWDNSVAINAPGQSGDQRSPHYSDLHGKWSAGEYFPLLYSAESIEEHAVQRVVLEPAP